MTKILNTTFRYDVPPLRDSHLTKCIRVQLARIANSHLNTYSHSDNHACGGVVTDLLSSQLVISQCNFDNNTNNDEVYQSYQFGSVIMSQLSAA